MLLIASVFLIKVSEAQVFVLTPVSPIQAQDGDNITLHWDYHSSFHTLNLAQWGTMTPDGTLETIIAQQQGNKPVEYLSSSYKDRVFVTEKASLSFINVKMDDGGRYGCKLAFRDAEILNYTILEVSARATTDAFPTADGTADDDTINTHPIYLAFVAVVLFLIILVVVYLFITCRKREALTGRKKTETARPDTNMIEMNPVSRNYMYADTETTLDANGSYDDVIRQEYSVIPPILPNATEKDWEVPKENLVLVKVIGRGAFGKVARGMAKGINENREDMPVAIKMLKENATDENRQDLLAELNMMKKLEPHQNVIQLLGCVTKSDPVMVITEYVPYGDLLGYLRKSRGLHDTYYNDPDIKPQSSLGSDHLFSFAWDIASGMDYLSSKKIVHRDLAARNVLVGEEKICKITDFGLARDVFKEDLYRRTATGRLPVKWTAFESLLYGTCTTMSDIWSYGIVMYEIFTIGGSPYPKIDGKSLASLLQEGYRMPKPSHLDEQLYKVMNACWNEKPKERPSFAVLRGTMEDMSKEKGTYINLQDYDSKLYQNVDDMDA